jgi:putative tricarboxylic transport membrane protein
MKKSNTPIITNPEKAGALFFLVLSIAYGLYAFKIQLTFLSQEETFNARTVPFILAVAGVLFSMLIIILPPVKSEEPASIKEIFQGLDWGRTWLLIILMVGYGIAMTWLGFIISSILFLGIGFYLLGERRIKVILLASIPLVIGIWILMSKVLGMYIAPGEIFYIMGVIK